MSLPQDNGTSIKSRHQQRVIYIQTSKRTSFEQLFHLDFFTLVRTANSPQLLYLAASWLVVHIINKAHTHTIHIYLPFTRKSKG